MPYIKQDRRNRTLKAENAGELNWHFSDLCIEYLINKGVSYQTYNDIIGALEGCKLELYREFIADYEDEKKKLNGDII